MNSNRKYLILWATVAFALFFFGASPALAQISLGSAQSFGVLGGFDRDQYWLDHHHR